MSSRAWWVLCPTDGTAHLLAIHGPGLLMTQCGQQLPAGVLQYDRLPSRHLCQDCFTAYLLPPAVAHKIPAARWPSNEAPGGQSAPPLPPPRWTRCPVDRRLHLLSLVEAAAAAIQGCYGRAACGRLIAAAGSTSAGPSAGMCLACLATRTAR